jgi:hypothetical protein
LYHDDYEQRRNKNPFFHDHLRNTVDVVVVEGLDLVFYFVLICAVI